MKAMSKLRSAMLHTRVQAHMFCSVLQSRLRYRVLPKDVEGQEGTGSDSSDSDREEKEKPVFEL